MKKLIWLLLLPKTIYSQKTIQLDRPDQTETVAIVPKNYLQEEAGFILEKSKNSEVDYLLPSILWKYGLNNIVELRLLTEFKLNLPNNQYSYQLQPIAIGLKSHLIDEKGAIPSISFIGEAEITKNNVSGKKMLIPSFRFTLQNTITKNMSLGYNLGIEWNEEMQETYIYTLTIGQSITKKINYYLEIYGFLNPYKTADHRIDGGFTYLINNDFMIDISSGIGLSKISISHYYSLGISYRLKLNK